ncbi:hypothetical protein [Ferrimonas pelagia]|uniref:Uncharacterized protein n=1 Tax=Ferrimonas pelagia TaxID=1177826 RepID=A0ABP9FHC2_9GAMM
MTHLVAPNKVGLIYQLNDIDITSEDPLACIQAHKEVGFAQRRGIIGSKSKTTSRHGDINAERLK